MDFNLTEDQRAFRDAVAAFARKELADGALARGQVPQFPHDIARKMSAAGLLGITLPEADGGGGGTLMDAVLAIEQVALVCPRSADVIQKATSARFACWRISPQRIRSSVTCNRCSKAMKSSRWR